MVIQTQSSNRQPGFTLIEMLAVIAIIGIILAAGLPAVMSLMRSGGVSAATREVSNTLNLARQYAITQRTNTRVIFAYNDNSADTLATENLWYIGYTVVASNRDVSGPQAWQYIGKWEFLPPGAVFLAADTMTGGNAPNIAGWNLDLETGAGIVTNWLNHASIPYPNTNSPNLVSFACMEFTPTGALLPFTGSRGASSLTISAGFMMPDQNNNQYPTPFRPPNSVSNYVNISADFLIGRIRVTQPQ